MTVDLVQSFQNRVLEGGTADFPGMRAPTVGNGFIVEPRAAMRVPLREGDVITINARKSGIRPIILAFDEKGLNGLNALNLIADTQVGVDEFDAGELVSWISAQGGGNAAQWMGFTLPDLDDPPIMRAARPVTVWMVSPITQEDFVLGRAAGETEVRVRRAQSGSIDLPPPLGVMRDEFTIDRATARAYRLRKGDIVQIIDVEGQQCSDFMCFRSDALERGVERMIDNTVTRTMVRGAFPGPGLFDQFFDSDMRPLINVVQDTVGRHDTFALACTARGYEDRGFPGHVNCSDNISSAVAPFSVAARPAWPAINFFFNSWIDRSDNRIQSAEAWSRAGDYVALRALDDLICVSTACPDDIDPINGWNPTDVHVRIYQPDAPIQRAVAYREKENAVPVISEESVFFPRTGKLTQNFQPARNIWAPGHYAATGAISEYWRCREGATVQDMSGLRKYDVKGPDAEALLQRTMTRDISRLAVHRGTYGLICDETGAVIDDGTLFRLAPDLFRWCCGTEESGRWLSRVAEEENLRVRIEGFQGALPNLALQGPKSRDILRKVLFTNRHVPDLDNLKWFGVTVGRLHDRDGAPFMLTRTGFTGELGYELFFDKSNALEFWDALMAAGEEFGIVPMGGDALEMLRVEAGLMIAGAEFTPGVDAFEAGLGFAVNLNKSDFIGKAALERNAANPRQKLVGLLFDGDEVPNHGDPVLAGERTVGTITSAIRSPSLEKAIAMARIAVEFEQVGSTVSVGQLDGRIKRLKATITDIPFVDPKRIKPRA